MRGSNFIPIVVAGVVGIAIGWGLAPDYDDVREDLGSRIDGVAGQLQTEIQTLQTSVSELSQQAAAPADDVMAQTQSAISALGTRLDELTGEFQTRTEALGQSLQTSAGEARDTASAKLDSLAAAVEDLKGDIASGAPGSAENAAGAGGSDPAALAGQIGNTGAILLPGQSAIFGGTPVALVAIAAETGNATLAVAGGDEQDVAAGSSIDVGNNCQVTVAGIAAGAAYLGSQDCADATAPASGGETQQAEAAPAEAAPAPEAAASPDTAAAGDAASSQAPAAEAPAEQPAEAAEAPAEQPAETAAADAAPAADPAGDQSLPIGDTAIFGETRVFVSAIGEDNATLFVVGGDGRQTVAVGEALDAGNGCSVTVESISDGQVTLAGDNCAGGTGEAQAAPESGEDTAASTPQGAIAPAAEAPAQAEPEAPAEASAAAPAGDGGITVGQTATFGDKKVFVSGLINNGAVLYVVGGGRQQVETGSSADLGDGCTAVLDRVENRTVFMTPNGC
ncbi:hypothetical protein VQ042_17155 [Aurantimonas sp. A2-1-M11]|uniref:hypothetical protein n=1 Tax=Aurantimonas sp. A2-1-M11 TaxID=3113712 RepID=UPI002F9425F4